MIIKIIDAISLSINKEFGDFYEVYTESVKQGFKEPCFFISVVESNDSIYLNNKYYGEAHICINYFPELDKPNKECHEIAKRLYNCLEYINSDGDLYRGVRSKYDIFEDVLNFYVSYRWYYYKLKNKTIMEDISYKIGEVK